MIYVSNSHEFYSMKGEVYCINSECVPYIGDCLFVVKIFSYFFTRALQIGQEEISTNLLKQMKSMEEMILKVLLGKLKAKRLKRYMFTFFFLV